MGLLPVGVQAAEPPDVPCPVLDAPVGTGRPIPGFPSTWTCAWNRALDGSYRVAGSDAGTPLQPGKNSSTQVTGVNQSGVNRLTRAKQWVRVPYARVAAIAPTNVSSYGPDLAEFPQQPPPGKVQSKLVSPADVFFISPDGAADRFGQLGPFPVRTVAFGAIPVEADVTLRQPRTASGAPESISIRQVNYFLSGAGTYSLDATGSGRVEVRLSDVRVDDVPVEVSDACRTVRPARLDLKGKGAGAQKPVPKDSYLVAQGGYLHGNLDIPAFEGCSTGDGDDVSPLLTALASGTSNPLTLAVGGIQRACFPVVNEATCRAKHPGQLPLPSGPHEPGVTTAP